MNIVDPILHLARRQPNAPAIIMPNGIIRYAQLDSYSHSIAAHLLVAGIASGDAVVIEASSSIADSILITLALARIGAISVVLSTGLSSDAKRQWSARLGCKAICTTDSERGIEGLSSIILDGSSFSRSAKQGTLPSLETYGDSVARIVFSSGTTGQAKAIAWTHGAIGQRIMGNRFGLPAIADDRLLLLATLHAGFAFNTCFKHLYAGGAIVAARVQSFNDLAATVNRYAVTHVAMSSFNLTWLLETGPASAVGLVQVAAVTFAGAALPEVLWRKAANLFRGQVLSHYGATEVGPAAFGDVAMLGRYPDAVGRLLPWVCTEAVDENDRVLPPGEPGILRIRTPGMATAYLDDPAATAQSFRRGWFYPGDIGAISADGIIRVTGRQDDLMNLGGEKIAPSAVENVLANADGVRQVAVTALLEPDGSRSVGVGVVAQGPLNREDLLARCRAVIPMQIAVRFITLEAIPRNPAGKVVRSQLAAHMLAALGDRTMSLS